MYQQAIENEQQIVNHKRATSNTDATRRHYGRRNEASVIKRTLTNNSKNDASNDARGFHHALTDFYTMRRGFWEGVRGRLDEPFQKKSRKKVAYRYVRPLSPEGWWDY